MATTFVQLEVKDRHKVQILNENFAVVPQYLGEFATDPATLNVPEGSTYYNTGSSKLMFLNSLINWVNVA